DEWKPLLTILVIGWAFFSFITEQLPVDMTALTIMVLLIVLGLVDESEGISGFSNPATITVMAMFVLSAGIARTGALRVVMDLLLKLGGKRVSQQILALGIIVGPISAFINNSAVVPTFLPIVESWADKIGVSVSRLLIPLSYLSIIGGTVTVIGTSTNVLASGISVQLGYPPFPLFLFTGVGLVAFGAGLLYLAFIAPYLLPDRQPLQTDGSFEQRYGLREYVSEVVISPESSLVGQTLRLSLLQRQFDVDVLEIIRDNTHFPQPLADKVLQVGDILLIRGARDELFKISREKGIYILPEQKFSREDLTQELEADEYGVGEVLIMANSRLVGSTLKDIRFRQRYNATVLAIRRGQELVRQR
ncbi:MAG: SLC13 family permease, partial [Cyanobacteria bacterium J06555_12]